MKKNKVKMTIEEIINANNLLFGKASKAQKRVMIAEDAIARVKSKIFNPTNDGLWITKSVDIIEQPNKSLQKALIGKEIECKCCALGGLMASCVVFNNNVNTDDMRDSLNFADMEEYEFDDVGITKIFSKIQLRLIEIAFELGNGNFTTAKGIRYAHSDEDEEDIESIIQEQKEYNYLCRGKQVDAAFNFGKRYRTAKTRFLAIMQNIIDNKGTFKP